MRCDVAHTTQVVLYGSSLYMTGLAVSLTANPWLDVIHIPSCSPTAASGMEAPAPAAIVLDLNEVSPEHIFLYLRTHPSLMLIGVDLTSEDIFFLSGRHVRVVTINDMIQRIAEAIGDHQSFNSEDESTAERE